MELSLRLVMPSLKDPQQFLQVFFSKYNRKIRHQFYDAMFPEAGGRLSK